MNVARKYIACYAFEKRQAPMAPLGPEDRTTVHVGQPGFFSLGYTLCGRKVSRRKPNSSPGRVTCPRCKRRWEAAAGTRQLSRPAANEITNRREPSSADPDREGLNRDLFVPNRASPETSGLVSLSFRFSGVADAKLSPVLRVLCAVADRR